MSLLPVHKRYAMTRLEVHWAAQIPAAASGILEASDDYSHTTLSLLDGCLTSQPLPDGRRVGVHLSTLQLRLGEMSSPDSRFELEGRRLDDGLAWLRGQLGEVALLPHDLPERPDAPFIVAGAGTQLEEWLSLGETILAGAKESGGGGPVRLWPHHFDMATLIELDTGGDEAARSINMGLSLGDGSYAEPYWYVTPWPTPSAALPELDKGHWHTDGFTAAVFPASDHSHEAAEEAAAFIAAAHAASLTLLGG